MDKVKIPIKAEVLNEMYAYAHAAHKAFGTEIAGWAHYNKDKGIYKLAPLLPQEVSGAEVSSFPDEHINDMKYDISDMLVQWHSHVMFGCSPSQPDKDLIKEALKLMPMIISIIVNCKGEYSATVSLKQAGAFTFQDLVKLDAELVTYYDCPAILKEVKKKCYKPKPKPLPVADNAPHWHKGQFGKWNNGVFVPENKNLASKPNTPIHNITPQQHYNNVGFVPYQDDDDLFPDYVEAPTRTFNQLAEYGDIIKCIQDLQANDDMINVWMADDYYIVLDTRSGNYVEVTPDMVTINTRPTTWNEAIKRLGITDVKYFLTKKDENKV
jgi:proteasome lid subunit RPN8/RPN11